MLTKEQFTEMYERAIEMEKTTLKKIKEGENVQLTYLGLSSDNESKSWYYLFVERDLEKAKQCFYLYGKIMEYTCKNFTVSISPGMATDGAYTLLSDSKELWASFPNWTYRGYDKFIKKGEPKRIIQLMMAEQDEEASILLDTFFAKYRKYASKELDGGILRGILEKNKDRVEELISVLLTPKVHERRNGIYPVQKDLFSLPALGFAKLAWIRGVEVAIDHPLIPKELLPVRPNKVYEKTYDFLLP